MGNQDGSGSPRAFYEQRREVHASRESQLRRWNRRLPHLRSGMFALSALLLLVGWLSPAGTSWYTAGALAFCGLVALASFHEFVEGQLRRRRLLREFNEHALARLQRRWDAIPEISIEIPEARQTTSNDLDLFGHASLFQLLCVAKTPWGIETLRNWILDPADPAEVRLRHEAVDKLAGEAELRETLATEGALLSDRGQAIPRFVEWAEGDGWLHRRPWLLWTCRVLSAAVLTTISLIPLGMVPPNAAGVVIVLLLVINFFVSVLFVGRVHDVFNAISARSGEASRYASLFHLMYTLPDSTSKLSELRDEATCRGGGVLRRMAQLSRISRFAAMSRSAVFFLVYLLLQFTLLYDFHVLDRYEAWARKHGRHVRRWFRALAEFEALASLAVLRHDHAAWCLPDLNSNAGTFRAIALGHPLLPDGVRVDNDVQLGPAGTFLLVTGSNMSGKSTLLRAIGVNAVLAQAGAPVCASRLELPPVALATNMRVRDSLEYGVSFYMAELMRLKEIVDLAREPDQRQERLMLYLLDEILQGTNSRERHIAVVRVVHHLLESGAIGAISTHDLELAGSEQLSQACQSVHFRETLHDQDAAQPMTFDYRLRPGVATTTNALKLLDIVGLGE